MPANIIGVSRTDARFGHDLGQIGGHSVRSRQGQSRMINILYLSYDGLMDPLGYSQVFQYLKKLARGNRIYLITFEKKENWRDRERRDHILTEVQAAGIHWHPLRYHRHPPVFATSFDIICGFLLACLLVLQQKISIVHARSYVPSVVALGLKRLFGVRFIFDMRGFWADEKVDNGNWVKGGPLYRIAKRFERRFLLAADRVVSLTHAAVDEMRGFDYLQGRMPAFEVITTCVDTRHFFRQRGVREAEPAKPESFIFGYVGSATYSYLFDEALTCFKLLRELEPGACLLILNRSEHAFIRERLIFHGIPNECVELKEVEYPDLPREMSRMDACVFFIRQVYAKIASAPTKLGELLGCGVPCLSNTGVGDMASILEGERVGALVSGFSQAQYSEALRRILNLAREPEIHDRCRQAAERHYALEQGVRAYARVYDELGHVSSVREGQNKDQM